MKEGLDLHVYELPERNNVFLSTVITIIEFNGKNFNKLKEIKVNC